MTDPLSSRRAVVAGIMALGLPSTATCRSVLPPQRLEDDNAFEKWIQENAGTGSQLIVPADALPLSITRSITIPEGADIVFKRDLDGTPNGKLIFAGDSYIRFDRSSNQNVSLNFLKGKITVQGMKYRGDFHQAAIFIEGQGLFESLLIEDITVENANFGILRQGEKSHMNGAIIRRASFINLKGDAIEWNICPNDTGMIFEDIIIDTLNDFKGRGNWGIGIGLAGLTFDPEWDRSKSIKQFIVRRVSGRRVRQLIHVEAGTDFTISDVIAEQISEKFSANSNMPSGVICCYGCHNFNINNIESDGDILIMAGVIAAQYVVPSANFSISNVKMKSGSIITEMGGKLSYANFENINIMKGGLKFFGMVKYLEMTNITASGTLKEPSLYEKPDFLSGPLLRYVPNRPIRKQIKVSFDKQHK